ncbi:putative zinc finger (CCCH type) protein [Neospora caninum Liverpool]|uniref:Putative zinc finger (CCCH type) protein n=1 Tax=Neospora caninum (strain Liverpool) TaxID=572307 RepID=F0V7P2_NEOCL|nr:putative zinc finger (CCCH type) protein [Neospora caninum Liverpool]CBZ49733.1 putative zinc finger (CCCH type) protein [Neospora caninum Liverpool]CEL64317.1 TPA: zinc finger (CCCH type) protein, putative [Neospora caninum Liverpool]|eukprot:XP_003879768.1 putative zinc finger (CCCH type) protein [Neospora caninum Liverpool]
MDVTSISGDGFGPGKAEKGSFPSLHRYSVQPLGDSRSTAPSSSSSRGQSADDRRATCVNARNGPDADVQFSTPCSGSLNEIVAQSPKNAIAKKTVSPLCSDGVAELKTRMDRAILVDKTNEKGVGSKAQSGDFTGETASPFRSSSPSTEELTVAAVSDEGTVSPPNGTEGPSASAENATSAEGSGDGALKWDRAYCKHFLFGRCARRRCRFLHGDAEVVQQQRRLLEMDTAAAAAANGSTQSEESSTRNAGAANPRQTRERKAGQNPSGGGAVLVRNDDRRDDSNKLTNRFFASHGGNSNQPQRRGSQGQYTPMGVPPPCRFGNYQQPNRSLNGIASQEGENRCKQIPGTGVHRCPPGVPGQAPYVPFFYSNTGPNGGTNPVRSPSPPGTYLTSPMFAYGGPSNSDASGGNGSFVPSSQTYFGNGQGAAPWVPATPVPPPPAAAPSPFMPQTLYGSGAPSPDPARRPPPPSASQFLVADNSTPLRSDLDFALALASAAAEQLSRSEEKFSAAKVASVAAQELAAQLQASSAQRRQDGANASASGFPWPKGLAGATPPGGFQGSPASPPSDLRFVQAAESLAERCHIPFVSIYLPGQGYVIQFVEGVAGTNSPNGSAERLSALADRQGGNSGYGAKPEGSTQATHLASKEFPGGGLEKAQVNNAQTSAASASATDSGDLAGKREKPLAGNPLVSTTRSWLDVLKAPAASGPCKPKGGEKKSDHTAAVGSGDRKTTHASGNPLSLFDALQDMSRPVPPAGDSAHAVVAPPEEASTSSGWPSLTHVQRQDGAQSLESGETRQTNAPLERDTQLLPNVGTDVWARSGAPLVDTGVVHPSQQVQTVLSGRPQEPALGVGRRLISATESRQAGLRQNRQPGTSAALSAQGPSHPHACIPAATFSSLNQVPEDRDLNGRKGLGAAGSGCFSPSFSSAGLFLGADKEATDSLRPDFLRLGAIRREDLQKREAGRGDGCVASSPFLNSGAPSLQDTLLSKLSGSCAPAPLPFQAHGDLPSLSLQQQMAAALSQAHTTTGGANTFSSGSFPWLVSDFAASTTECGFAGVSESAGDLGVFSGRGTKVGDVSGVGRPRPTGDGCEGAQGEVFSGHEGVCALSASHDAGLLRSDRSGSKLGLKPKSPPRKLSGWIASAFQNRVGSDPRFFLDDFAEELGRGFDHEEDDDKLSKMDTHFTLKSLDSRRNSSPGGAGKTAGLFHGDMSLSPTAALIASIWQKAGIDDDEIHETLGAEESQPAPRVNKDGKILSSF